MPTQNICLLGTGLSQSIVAAALSRLELEGLAVYHLDTGEGYGGSICSTFTLDSSKLSSLFDSSFGAYVRSNPRFSLSSSSNSSDNSKIMLGNSLDKKLMWNVDLFPQLIYADGELTRLLTRSAIGKYLDFKQLSHIFIKKCSSSSSSQTSSESKWLRVPFCKEDVFVDKSVSLVEKRRLMKAVFSLSTLDSSSTSSSTNSSLFKDYLSRELGVDDENHRNMIVYGCLFVEGTDELESLGIEQAIDRLHTYFSSLRRFPTSKPSPFLISMYGSSELVQAFSRVCAIYGGTHALGQQISTSENLDGKFKVEIGSEATDETTFLADHILTDNHHISTISSDNFNFELESKVTSITRKYQYRGVFLLRMGMDSLWHSGHGITRDEKSTLSDSAIFIFPPENSLSQPSSYCSYIVMFGSDTAHAPIGHTLLHVMLNVEMEVSQPHETMIEMISQLEFHLSEDDDNVQKRISLTDYILDSLVFSYTPQCKSSDTDQTTNHNIKIVSEDRMNGIVISDENVSNVKRVFEECCKWIRDQMSLSDDFSFDFLSPLPQQE